jgi:pre-rRNA-processing protein TSR3
MTLPPATIIIRHRKENLKKCSLRGLENRADLHFFSYPFSPPSFPPSDLSHYVLLSFDGPLLSPQDSSKGLYLLDGTWRYTAQMAKQLPLPFEKRSLPPIHTAYPRCQSDFCTNPERGLATVEALFISLLILGRKTEGILDHYYWKKSFLEKNYSYISLLESKLCNLTF